MNLKQITNSFCGFLLTGIERHKIFVDQVAAGKATLGSGSSLQTLPRFQSSPLLRLIKEQRHLDKTLSKLILDQCSRFERLTFKKESFVQDNVKKEVL